MKARLPCGWTEVPLGQVAELVMGQAPPGSSCNFEGEGIPFVKAGEFGKQRPIIREWTTKPLRMARYEDVLICVVGATAGKLNLGADCAIGRSVAAIRSIGSLSQKFIYYQLLPKVLELRAGSAGSAQGVIKSGDLAAIRLRVAPLAEQHRILAAIEEHISDLDAAVAALVRARRNVYRYMTAVREKSLREFEAVSLGTLLAEPLANGRSVPTAVRGFPVLRLTSLKAGRIDLNERKIGAWTAAEAQAYWVREGDFLIARGNGSRSLVGRGGLVGAVTGEVAFPDTMIRVRPVLSRISPAYLRIVWDSAAVRQQVEGRARTTAGIYKINQRDLEEVIVPLPPREEQNRIVAEVESRFTVGERMIAEVDTQAARAARLRQSILKRAFEGKLVAHDPSEEPASMLLERIQAERGAEPSATRRRRNITGRRP